LAGETLEYGVMVSTGEVIMKDGKNLDGVGVTPDLKLLPTPEDLAAGRDPALSMAISLAGHKIDPEQAGELLARN
jgi:C-terminal processing protease CtpA/Prc